MIGRVTGEDVANGEGERAPEASQLRPSIHPTYARLLVAELKRRGFPEAEIVHSTRLDWSQLLEEDHFLSIEQLRRLVIRSFELTGEGWLGLDVGRSTQVSSHGPIGYAMVASADVRQALEVAVRYSSLRLQVTKFALDQGDGRLRLRIEPSAGWGELEEYISLHIVGGVSVLLETVSGMQLPDTRVALAYAEPAWSGEYRERLKGVELEFDAAVSAIDLPESFVSTPCITADATAFREAIRLCERTEARHETDGDLSQQVLERLLDRQGDYPSLSEMAKALHLSDRTLNRKLKAQGTSYQMLLDDVRQELAMWYLRQTQLPIEAIADRLGYRDTSNFSRTCKRWFGVTPRAIRMA